MSIFYRENVDALKGFVARPEQLGIVRRKTPDLMDEFFASLMQKRFGIAGLVHKISAQRDIRDVLEPVIPKMLRQDSAFDPWVEDMAQIVGVFCAMQATDAICFWLGSERGCRRYHIDNVPMRMLVTYAGQGTEWVPDEAADRRAFADGAPNEAIVKDPTALQYMKRWDVAVFRGGPKGLLHRTPDAALEGPSILMRLDHPSFWEDVLKPHQGMD